MTLAEMLRLLEGQRKPETVSELCERASAQALVSIALDIDTISNHLWKASLNLASISDRIEILENDIDLIERSLSKIEQKMPDKA